MLMVHKSTISWGEKFLSILIPVRTNYGAGTVRAIRSKKVDLLWIWKGYGLYDKSRIITAILPLAYRSEEGGVLVAILRLGGLTTASPSRTTIPS
jgi:hypothetical protein